MATVVCVWQMAAGRVIISTQISPPNFSREREAADGPARSGVLTRMAKLGLERQLEPSTPAFSCEEPRLRAEAHATVSFQWWISLQRYHEKGPTWRQRSPPLGLDSRDGQFPLPGPVITGFILLVN